MLRPGRACSATADEEWRSSAAGSGRRGTESRPVRRRESPREGGPGVRRRLCSDDARVPNERRGGPAGNLAAGDSIAVTVRPRVRWWRRGPGIHPPRVNATYLPAPPSPHRVLIFAPTSFPKTRMQARTSRRSDENFTCFNRVLCVRSTLKASASPAEESREVVRRSNHRLRTINHSAHVKESGEYDWNDSPSSPVFCAPWDMTAPQKPWRSSFNRGLYTSIRGCLQKSTRNSFVRTRLENTSPTRSGTGSRQNRWPRRPHPRRCGRLLACAVRHLHRTR